MKGNRFVVMALAVALAFSPSLAFAQAPPVVHHLHHSGAAWWIVACPGAIIAAASVKNWKRHKELNEQEAWTCGLLYWWNESVGAYGY